MNFVEQFTAWNLTCQPRKPSRRQYETDLLLGPVLACKKRSQIGAEARHYASEKQIDRVESVQGGGRGLRFNGAGQPRSATRGGIGTRNWCVCQSSSKSCYSYDDSRPILFPRHSGRW